MATRLIVERDVACRTRDGVTLMADVYRPDDGERHPVLIQRTPYDKTYYPFAWAQFDPTKMAALGYNVVIQDVRGRFASEGEYTAWADEAPDGVDTIAWAATQPWSDGNVGMYGMSYMAGVQWLAAQHQPPALRALASTTSPNDAIEDHIIRGGALHLGLLVSWTLASIGPNAVARRLRGTPSIGEEFTALVDDLDDLDEVMRTLPLVPFPPIDGRAGGFAPTFDERASVETPGGEHDALTPDHSRVTVPALVIAGWHDAFLQPDLNHFAAMRETAATEDARRLTRMVIGPWAHASFTQQVGEIDFGLRASSFLLDMRENFTSLHARWFDTRLKGIDTGIDDDPPVKYFVMGANRWKTAGAWPPPGLVQQRWHAHGSGALSLRAPSERDDATSESSVFTLDPDDPVPTHGGGLLMHLRHIRGPREQSRTEQRDDVLVFSSDVLQKDVEVTGPVRFVCWVAGETVDTDVVARLCDVQPDGRSYDVCDGILRLRFRESLRAPKPLTPGEVVRAEVDMWSTAHLFRAGHRLRLQVCASDFPRFDRCPGTGETSAVAKRVIPQHNRLFHDPQRPSHLLLHVVTQ